MPKNTSRRDFIKGAAGAGVAMAGLGSFSKMRAAVGNNSMRIEKGNVEATGLKYEKYFTKDVVRENKWGGEGIGPQSVPDGIIRAGARMTLGISVVRKPYMFHEPTHKHDFTEFFIFFGSNPMDLNDFDADVEFSFGPEREKHVITSPTIVTIPPGVYHCPLNYA